MTNYTAPAKLPDVNRKYSYTVEVKLQPRGPVVHCETVLPADLIELYSEAWLNDYLRNGQPDIGYSDLAFRLFPVLINGSSHQCAGLLVESQPPDGTAIRDPIGVEALRTVAERGAKRLLESGTLAFGQPYYYGVIARELSGVNTAIDQTESVQSESSKITYTRLNYRKVRIASLIKKATAFGAVDEGMPVFLKKSAYLKAERFSRNGARYHPPVESGAVVLGWLGSCPDSGEFYVVATDVIELVDTLQNKISLTYTDKTWANIHAVLKERQSTPAANAERIVGQCHGHNFLPCFGEKECHHCRQQMNCAATSVFVSENDLLWSRCVFSRQPWAFCQIFGLDARGAQVQRMFGFKQGRLVERGFYIIP